ncbi:MAG: CHASE2 domain-containing protein [Geminocystis sp.]|nr:CHASE2 domain-containing protein [Geminocystis sp.]MCS7148399.1 CHASE2 domain-containing protein [Geminocystis sp.]MDW8116013.1 CHASE2 domain-containing protein [Geminocystis sp.]MDW8463646.1 CHASE2 domain-containing protein [Geminocystis sp.]
MKLISLKLGRGDWHQGIPNIQIQLWLTPHLLPIQFSASLPPNPPLFSLYSHWQTLYKHLVRLNIHRGLPEEEIEFEEEDLSHISTHDFEEVSARLKSEFNRWLDSPSFASTEAKIRSHLGIHDEINLILETDNDEFRSFPWMIWDFFDDYPQAEIAISPKEYTQPIVTKKQSHKYVRILAIIGNNQGINVEKDKEFLEGISRAKIRFLVQPSRRELEENLWDEKGWDILFFAGHSWRCSQQDNVPGYLAINSNEYISISNLKNALKRAIQLGLKMAIFNSCDGLGLAKQLAELNLPQMIVMRFSVPDVVAQEFLKYFLSSYSRGKSFYLAVREARERLEALEDKFPAATWLPVICQNPSSLPLSWLDLCETTTPSANSTPISHSPSPVFVSHHKPKLNPLITGLLVSILVFTLRSLGYLQGIELKTLDWLQKHKQTSPPDNRLLIVGIDEEDIRRYGYPIPDKTLLLLLQRLQSYHPTAIGVDIFRDQPTPSPQDYHNLVSFITKNPNIVTVCNRGNGIQESVGPPKQTTMEQVGYADLYNDLDISGDYTIRRYLLSRSQNPIETPNYCQTDYSFAWHLIYRHLSHQQISVSVVGDSWRFGEVTIPPLSPGSGGYQRLDTRGNQIIINYRNTPQISQQLALRDILEAAEYINPQWLENKIILVGMVAESIPDTHDTPLGKMRGIYIHAHVISQILDATETNGKNLIWWLPPWGDFLVILLLTMMGLFLPRLPLSKKLPYSLVVIFFLLILWLCCKLAFRFYLWLPLIPSSIGFFSSATLVKLTDTQ